MIPAQSIHPDLAKTLLRAPFGFSPSPLIQSQPSLTSAVDEGTGESNYTPLEATRLLLGCLGWMFVTNLQNLPIYFTIYRVDMIGS